MVWIARGLGGRRAFLMLQRLGAELKPLLLFISKIRISCKVARKWLSVLNFYGLYGVDAKGTRGGLLLFWHNNISVSLRSYFFNHIDVNVVWDSLQ